MSHNVKIFAEEANHLFLVVTYLIYGQTDEVHINVQKQAYGKSIPDLSPSKLQGSEHHIPTGMHQVQRQTVCRKERASNEFSNKRSSIRR